MYNIIKKITSIGYLPRWIILITDVILCIFAYTIAYQLSHHFYYFQYPDIKLYKLDNFLITLLSQIFWFWVFKTYAGIIRYSTFVDITKLLYSIFATLITLFGIHSLSISIVGEGIFLRLGIILYCVFAFLLLLFLRIVVKTVYDIFIVSSGRTISVVIYGTKSAGISIAKMIRSETTSRYRVVGFVDDSRHQDKQIFGLPIYSTRNSNLISTLEKKNVKAIVVSPLKLNETDLSPNLNIFVNAGLQLLMIPQLTGYKEGDEMEEFNIERNLRNIQIEDLLGRSPIEMDKTPIKKMISNKVVLITGAAGSIGSEIVRQLSTFKPRKLILLDNAETPLHNIKLELTEKFCNIEYAFIIDVYIFSAKKNFFFSIIYFYSYFVFL